MERFDKVFFRIGLLYIALVVPYVTYLEAGNYYVIIPLLAACVVFGICALAAEKMT